MPLAHELGDALDHCGRQVGGTLVLPAPLHRWWLGADVMWEWPEAAFVARMPDVSAMARWRGKPLFAPPHTIWREQHLYPYQYVRREWAQARSVWSCTCCRALHTTTSEQYVQFVFRGGCDGETRRMRELVNEIIAEEAACRSPMK